MDHCTTIESSDQGEFTDALLAVVANAETAKVAISLINNICLFSLVFGCYFPKKYYANLQAQRQFHDREKGLSKAQENWR